MHRTQTSLSSSAQTLLTELKNLLVETEPLYRWARPATLALREEILNMQHDTELIQLLLLGLPVSENQHLRVEAGAFQATLVASIPAIRIVTEGIAPLLQLLRAGDTVPRSQALLVMEDKRKIIAGTRESLSRAFSSVWLESRMSQKDEDGPRFEMPINSSEQLSRLVEAFNRIPFAIGATSDVFIQNAPRTRDQLLQLGQWQYAIENAAKHWLATRSQGGGVENLLKTHRRFLTLLWNGSMEAIRHINLEVFKEQELPVVKEMVESVAILRDGARDAILRSSSSSWSIAFVGSEDSGKSTFINALVGAELLPSDTGPTTSYPCRLRHSLSQNEPTLELGVKYLSQCLDELRRGEWASKLGALTAANWIDDGILPEDVSVQEFKRNWERLSYDRLQKLTRFTDPSFAFSSVVVGVDTIKSALNDLNDFVKICRALPIGFDHLDPLDWPVITLEFPRMKGESLPDGLTLFDIPGIRGFADSVWDEVTREIIRSAAIVVALVSLESFDSSPWRLLPRVVRQGTGIDVGAVILTKADKLPEEEIESREKYSMLVRSVFWPAFPGKDEILRPVIPCSALIGPSIDNLQEFIKDFGDEDPLPPWNAFEEAHCAPALRYLFSGNTKAAKDGLSSATAEDLCEGLADPIASFSFQDSFNAFKEVLNNVHKQSLVEYYGGLEVLTRGISFDIRTLMVLAGVAPGVALLTGSTAERQKVQEQMALLDAWNVQLHAFQDEVHSLVIRTQEGLAGELENYVDKALTAAARNLEHGYVRSSDAHDDNIKLPRFDDFQNIEKYISRYQAAFDELAKDANAVAAGSILERARKSYETLLGAIRTRLAMQNTSGPLEHNVVHPPTSTPISADALLQHVEEVHTRYTMSDAFSQVQLRVLKTINPGEDTQGLIRRLRFVSRALLIIVSSIPFVFTLPYWLQKTYVRAYTLSLSSLRPVLVGEATSQSFSFLHLIESEITMEASSQAQVAIQSKFPPAPYHGSVAQSLDGIQHMISASADVIALGVTAVGMQQCLRTKPKA